MKKTVLYFLSLAIISCNTNHTAPAEKDTNATAQKTAVVREGPAAPAPVVTPLTEVEKASAIASFREFRDAVYHHDKEKVKSFIDFPIVTAGNEIWFLALGHIDKTASAAAKKPFTATDMDRYFDHVFNTRFVTSILKIKADSLFDESGTSSPEFWEGDSLMYKMDVSYSKYSHSHILDLSVYQEGHRKGQDNTEGSDIFEFIVVDGKLRMRNVMIAG